MHQLIIKPSAELDAMNAANWYNSRRDGLGNEFLLALEAKFYTLRRNPLQYLCIYKNIRRALTERFPYGVFFIIENEVVYVLAIIHTSRSPKIWKKRK
ncbi:MAG: type II toxin-antitoxin system RelE/ParE family toxin [Bacteroidota bacterium]|nr:type II toxin-antitoxin system RelE/ParE family toxin [Bacteroidota bacterium]